MPPPATLRKIWDTNEVGQHTTSCPVIKSNTRSVGPLLTTNEENSNRAASQLTIKENTSNANIQEKYVTRRTYNMLGLMLLDDAGSYEKV